MTTKPKPAPDFPDESGATSDFQHLASRWTRARRSATARNKAAWWRAVEILRTLPESTDLAPVAALVQSWVDANCGGNLAEVDVAKQVRGAAKFVRPTSGGATRHGQAATRPRG